MSYQRSSGVNMQMDSSYGIQKRRDSSTVWNDIILELQAPTLGASAPDNVAYNGTSIEVYAFAGAATEEELHGELEYVHGAKEGADIYFHLHWSPTTTDAGNVKWQLAYVWINPGGGATSETVISVTSAATGTAWDQVYAAFPAISGTGKEIGSQLGFRLFRDPTDGDDTYGADAAITFTLGCHYESDTDGSRDQATK